MPRIGEPTAREIAVWVDTEAMRVARSIHPNDNEKVGQLYRRLIEHAASWLEIDRLGEVSPIGVRRYLIKVALHPRTNSTVVNSETLAKRLEEQVAAKHPHDKWGQVRSYIRAGTRVRSHKRRTANETGAES